MATPRRIKLMRRRDYEWRETETRGLLRAALAGTLVAAIGGQARQLGEEVRPLDCVCGGTVTVCWPCAQAHMCTPEFLRWQEQLVSMFVRHEAGPFTLLTRK